MYRTFTLKNSIGETLEMNGSERLFTSPSGLGYTQTNNLASIGSGFYINAKRDFPKRNLVGTVVFAGQDPYGQYVDFVNYLNKGYALTIIYNPNGTDYYAEIDVDYVQKGEYNNIGILEVPVSFVMKTPWYRVSPQTVNIEPGSGGNLSIFDLKFDFEFISENTDGSSQVSVQGHLPASIEVIVPGPLTNPTISLYSESGDVLGNMVLTATVPSGSTLRYSSKYLDPGVWIDDVEQIEQLNINNENFFRVPVDENCELRITSEGVASINATVNIYNYYRSV